MEAGRELDALVAEKVMGWKPLAGPAETMDEGFKRRYWDYAEKHALRLTPDDSVLPGVEHPVPYYSTKIGAAWEVVEKDDGWGSDWTLKRWVASSKPWSCTVERTTDGQVFYAEAETAPLAICLAALKATER